MDQKRSKQILESLLESTSTQDVETIIAREQFTNADWKPYGNREKNWDTVANQQTNAIGALTELITNAIDAVLSRKAYESGIADLKGGDAPQSMQDAVRRFYKITEGKLSSLEAKQLTKLAEQSILIGIRRKRKGGKYPTITVIDYGEGQNPKDFSHTFLSLSETNKEGISFVQGKFNMGSTGSIRFCTESDITKGHYKLIVSKKYDGDIWGYTLIRVSQVQEGKKLPVVEYLMPEGKIPFLQGDYISAFGSDDIGKIKQGSVIKLFDYDVGSSAHAVDFGLYQALTANLLECALPVRIYDFDAKRQQDKGELRSKGIAARTFSGMGVMLNADFSDRSQQDPDIAEQKPEKPTTEFVHLVAEDASDPELGTFRIVATGLSEMPNFIKNSRKRVFYTLNGQTHATETAGFFNSPRVKLGELQQHLIVNVQCEQMDKTALTIFMGNREQKIDNRLSRQLVECVQERLKNDSKLKQYQAIIRRRRAAQIIEENEDTKKLLSDLITQDPAIRELLGLGTAVVDIGQAPGESQTWQGKQFPTFLEPLNVRQEGDMYIKELPINTKRQIKCGTNAANDYLSRSNSPGWIDCTKTPAEVPRSVSLHNGTATFTFNPHDKAKVGDEITFDIGFCDNGKNIVPLCFPLTLRLTPPEPPVKNKPGKPTNTKEKKKLAIADPTHWVTENDWGDHNFDEKSGAAVVQSEDSITVYVNRDHERLKEMRYKEKDEAVRQLNESRFRICLGFLTLAVYKHNKQKEDQTDDASEMAKETSVAIAAYILPLIKTLGGGEQL